MKRVLKRLHKDSERVTNSRLSTFREVRLVWWSFSPCYKKLLSIPRDLWSRLSCRSYSPVTVLTTDASVEESSSDKGKSVTDTLLILDVTVTTYNCERPASGFITPALRVTNSYTKLGNCDTRTQSD
jgi:hypothetical protein